MQLIKKTYYVKVARDEVEYIKNHFKHARCEMARAKGKSYNMLLTYNEEDSQKVNEELQTLVDHKIIEYGL